LIFGIWPGGISSIKEFIAQFADCTLESLQRRPEEYTILSPDEDPESFFDRDGALKSLIEFSESELRYDVAIVRGPSGIGKTRLAVEWLAYLTKKALPGVSSSPEIRSFALRHLSDRARAWDVGFLPSRRSTQLLELTRIIAGWRPLRPTAIVIDTTEGIDIRIVREFEDEMFRASDGFTYPFRMLILSYGPVHLLDEELPRSRHLSSGTDIALGSLSADGIRRILSHHHPQSDFSDGQVQSLLETSGGVPFLVHLMALEPDERRPNPIAIRKHGDPLSILRKHGRRIFEEAQGVPFSTERIPPGAAAFRR
jgi:hypothetical protein